MVNLKRKLQIEQLDDKFEKLSIVGAVDIPAKGWIFSIRTAMNMSLAQLAKRLKKTIPSVKEIEEREQTKTITLNNLIEVANALDLRFYYGFLPREASIGKMVEKRAQQVARDIVLRTSHTMGLEDQQNSEVRIERAIRERAAMIREEIPKYLWD